jgi:two-component SAPR family response regulator
MLSLFLLQILQTMTNEFLFIVIDDDKINNLVCESVIRKLNSSYHTVSFLRAEDALEFLSGTPKIPFLVLLDINMPEMNGWEFLEKYINFAKCSPNIFLLSSSINQSDTNKSKTYTIIKDYIVKPLSKIKLENAVEIALKNIPENI